MTDIQAIENSAFLTLTAELGLGMRPIFHQKEHRVQAHIFVCFLALAMYKSMELGTVAKCQILCHSEAEGRRISTLMGSFASLRMTKNNISQQSQLWMASKGLGNSPAKLLEEFKEIRSMDVVLPVEDRNPIRLCVVGKPDEHARILLYRIEIKIPNRPKIVQNVVKTLVS